jgi:hypothetical protein
LLCYFVLSLLSLFYVNEVGYICTIPHHRHIHHNPTSMDEMKAREQGALLGWWKGKVKKEMNGR